MHSEDNSKSTEKGTITFAGLLFLFFIFHAFTGSPLFLGYGYDREVFRYFGMLIARGGIPYLDAFDHKPPIVYFVYFIGHLLNIGPWGGFIVFQIMGFLSTLFLFLGCKKHIGVSNSIIVALFYVALVKYDFIISEGGLTRELTAYLTTILFSVYLIWKRNLVAVFTSGVLFSIIFYTQQNEVIAILPLLIYFLISDLKTIDKESFGVFIKRAITFALGCILIHIAVIGLFFYWGALDEFVDQAFLFNTRYYIPDTSFIYRIIKVVYYLSLGVESYLPIFLVFILSVYPVVHLLLKKKRIEPVYSILLLSLVLQILSIAIGIRPVPHYFLGLIPYFVFILFILFHHYPQLFLKDSVINRDHIRIVASSIIIMLSVLKLYYYGHPNKRINGYKHDEQLYAEVKKVKKSRGELYSFDPHYLALNSDLNIIAPSKWIYQHFFGSRGFDDKGELLKSVLNDLEKTKCEYIIVPVKLQLSVKNKGDLKSYLKENYDYQLSSHDKSIWLYKRKSETP